MPVDARSLLRAAAAERTKSSVGGISDPFASYHPATGTLRCSACSFAPIKHENLWSPHTASKSHRTNIARLRQEEVEKQAKVKGPSESSKQVKRKSQNSEDQSESVNIDAKKAKTDLGTTDFGVKEQDDDVEWKKFEQELALDEAKGDETNPSVAIHSNATIEVEPVLHANAEGDVQEGQTDSHDKTQEDLEAEEKAKKEQEDREEIFSRLEEEQRLQDEAQERVSALKQRLERLKRARLEKKQNASQKQ